MPSNEHRSLHPFFERPTNSTLFDHRLPFGDKTCPANDPVQGSKDEEPYAQSLSDATRQEDGLNYRLAAEVENRKSSSNGVSESRDPSEKQVNVPLHQPSILGALTSINNVHVQPVGDSRKRRKTMALVDDHEPNSGCLPLPTGHKPSQHGEALPCQPKQADVDLPDDDTKLSRFTSHGVISNMARSVDDEAVDSSPSMVSKSNSYTNFGPHPSTRKARDVQIADERPLSPSTQSKPCLRLNGAGAFETTSRKDENLHQRDNESIGQSSRGAASRKATKMVILRYGQDNRAQQSVLGQKIDGIQSSSISSSSPVEQAPTRLQTRSKATHPFFRTKTAQIQEGSESKTITPNGLMERHAKQNNSVISFSSPGRLRYQAQRRFDDCSLQAKDQLQPHLGSSFRVPGTFDPIWPPKGYVNNGRRSNTLNLIRPANLAGVATRLKKKGRVTKINPNEDIIGRLSSRLITLSDPNKSTTKQWTQRLPSRLVISGQDLRTRVLQNLDISPDEESKLSQRSLRSLLHQIDSSMSPFDRGECESVPWAQKYAPKSTGEVLQAEREMQVLRSWLEGQIVVATDKGGLKRNKQHEERRKQAKKRQKRSADLEDFIVDDDEDTRSMRDFSDEENLETAGFANLPRSRVADDYNTSTGKNGLRTANAVLLSGPHGCGKTAAVLAAAKELCFEVFEIGPGSRRSGKDILDKVGDMALNHQVSGPDASLETGPTMSKTLPQTPAEDQGTLASFFTRAPEKKAVPKIRKDHALSAAPLDAKSTSQQKQSLILLEEVDVLFEQDKQFWETVVDLAMQSKRPIVMTCSDESLVPLEELSLHAILRLRPPREDLAAKYLLLLAAVEGHLLRYEAVVSLYRLRKFDLRASIVDLDFWCQMAVGDRKGGMEWHIARWPPGVDLDDYGRKLRVVSEGALVYAMGVLSLTEADDDNFSTSHEESLFEAWTEWNFEPSNVSSVALNALVPDEGTRAFNPLTSLRAYDNFASLISAADVYSTVGLPSNPQICDKLDITEPPMQDSQRVNFQEGLHLVQADLLVDPGCFDARVAISTHLGVEKLAIQMSHSATPTNGDNSNPLEYRERLLYTLLSRGETSNPGSFTSSRKPDLFASFDALRDDLQSSCFDHDVSVIAKDVAPYVRSIAAYEIALEHRREALSSSHNNAHGSKSQRRTRASRSALEGSQRDVARREKWFPKDLNLLAALQTGIAEWPRRASNETARQSKDRNVATNDFGTSEDEEKSERRGPVGMGSPA